MSYTQKLAKLLTALGRSNGSAPPSSQDPIDAELHKLITDDHGRKFFEKSYKAQLANVLDKLTGPNRKKVDNASGGDEFVVTESEHYVLNLKVSKGRETLDRDALIVALRTRKVSQKVIDEAFAEATKTSAPSKTFSVIER